MAEDTPEEIVVESADEATETPATPEVAAITPQEGVDSLKAKLAAERSAREAAEMRANEAAQGEAAARGQVHESQISEITTALGVVNSNAERLEEQYAEAAANGDWAAAAKLQTAMARNENNRIQLEQGKQALEATPKPTARTQPVTPSDPVEALAKQLTGRSAEWVRKHPEFASDPKKYNRMVAAHNLVVSNDVKPDSDEYFAEVEKLLGVEQARTVTSTKNEVSTDADEPLAASAQATGGRGAQPSPAPVSRGGTGTGSRPQVVRLTAAQRDAAAASGLTDVEYARNLEQLRKQGRLN